MKQSPPASTVYSLSCSSHDGSTLQVEFRRVGDRFAQSVRRLSSDGACSASWTGVQRSEPEAWPASPPIQELSLELIGGRDVLLGVGRAGKCHWSLSVETTQIDAVAALRFDIACRCPEQPQWLGSTYRIDTPRTGQRDEAFQAGEAADSALSMRCEDDTVLIDCGPETVRIEPIARPLKWPGTVRWRYSILLQRSRGRR